MQSKVVAQIWYEYNNEQKPWSNKFYTKVGTARRLAEKYTKASCGYKYFIKIYELKEITNEQST